MKTYFLGTTYRVMFSRGSNLHTSVLCERVNIRSLKYLLIFGSLKYESPFTLERESSFTPTLNDTLSYTDTHTHINYSSYVRYYVLFTYMIIFWIIHSRHPYTVVEYWVGAELVTTLSGDILLLIARIWYIIHTLNIKIKR